MKVAGRLQDCEKEKNILGRRTRIGAAKTGLIDKSKLFITIWSLRSLLLYTYKPVQRLEKLAGVSGLRKDNNLGDVSKGVYSFLKMTTETPNSLQSNVRKLYLIL